MLDIKGMHKLWGQKVISKKLRGDRRDHFFKHVKLNCKAHSGVVRLKFKI